MQGYVPFMSDIRCGHCASPGVCFNKQKMSLQRRLWELSANEEAAFQSATISKTSSGADRGFWKRGGPVDRVAVVRWRSPNPARGVRGMVACSPEKF